MISHKHKFVFIHIPSTAGTSIKNALSLYEAIPKHNPHALLSEIYEGTKDYFIFAFVRNPWDRIVSRYHYLIKNFPQHIFTFEEWLKGEKFNYNDVDVITKSRQQIDYLKIDNNVMVDYVGRFENIQHDFDIITNKLGFKKIELPKLNPTKHKPFKEYYTDELAEIVADWFKDDIKYFGYKWE